MSNFSETEKESIYRVIEGRRDVRSGFTDKQIDDETLQKILEAAHNAPSVGFMQPWNFILIKDLETRELIKENFLSCRVSEVELMNADKQDLYKKLKLEGILESPLNICITCDRNRGGETGLGRSVQPEMDLFSTVCAIQNLWLAARAEGIGIGWVSILEKAALKEILGLPESVEIVAYLCAGYVDEFSTEPDLAKAGWQQRLDLNDLIFHEKWGVHA
jgi:5,6-dimethylbenzimidazole synthase